MADGWIKLHRKMLDSAIWNNHELTRFWFYCLMKATHKPHKQTVGFRAIQLQPGEFVFGRKSASRGTGISEQTIRTCVKVLKTNLQLTTKTTSNITVLTICNWNDYQRCDNDDQPANQPEINHLPTTCQPLANHLPTTNKNAKNAKNAKEETIKSKPKRSSRFTPPTQEEVQARITEKGYSIDAEAFIAHYEGNGWMTGRNHVKSWKACLTTWSKNDFDRQKPKQPELVNYNPKAVFRAGNR